MRYVGQSVVCRHAKDALWRTALYLDFARRRKARTLRTGGRTRPATAL